MDAKEVKSWKQAKGKKELIKHLEGKRLPRGQAIKAKCYDCMTGYDDKKEDCDVPTCLLYEYMPYRKVDKGRNFS